MKRSRGIIIVVVVFVLGIGLAVGWFLKTYERVQVEEQTGLTGMARVNPFYAAELLLDDLDVPAESRHGLGVLPPEDHSVVVLTRDRQARRNLEPALREWVSRGGHLIVAALPPEPLRLGPSPRDENDDDESSDDDEPISVHDEDPLLVMAGLTLARTESSPELATDVDAPSKPTANGDQQDGGPPQEGEQAEGGPSQGEQADAGSSDDEQGDAGPPEAGLTGSSPQGFGGLLEALGLAQVERKLVTVNTPNSSQPLQIDIDTRWTLVDSISESHMMSYSAAQRAPRDFVPVRVVPMELGWVTAVVDPYFMTNQAIGEHDHARLVYELMLIDYAPPTGAVIVIRAQADSLFAMIWRHGWMAIIALVCLLFSWVWKSSRRFGPVLPEPDRSRRSLMEHIEAAGNFLWRHGYHENLLVSTREALKHKLAARLGGDTELEGDALEQAISAETGMRESRIHEAFYGGKPKDKRAFTQAMQELQQLWKAK